ncbi:phage portal protein [Methylobacterium goesingense]
MAMDLSGGTGFGAAAAETGPYDVANGSGRRSRTWRVGSYGPNTAITYALDELRRKSRDQTRKNPYAGAVVDKLVSNIIGTGIAPRSIAARSVEGLSEEAAAQRKKEDAAFRAELQRLHLAWTDEADAIGAHDYYGLQALAVRGMVEGGETFTRLRTRRPEDGLTVPLQLQLLEGDHCPHLKTDAANNIRQGIQYNAIGRRTGYYLYREHPGDGILTPAGIEEALVPATDVCHLYRAMRPGQDRGEPWLARALRTLYDLDGYLDAELVRKKNAARFLGFITKKIQDDLDSGPGSGVLGTDPAEDDGGAVLDLEPATLQVLAEGEEVTFSDPKDVGPNFDMFVRQSLRGVAVAAGVLYEELSGDYAQGNDRTLRAALNSFRRSIEMWQFHLVVFQFCRPVFRRWVDLALLSGALKLPEGMTRQDAYAVNWIPPSWPYIHPVQDVEGKILEIQSGLSTRTRKVAEGGYDAETLDAEQRADNDRADALGLVYSSDGRQKAKAPTTQPEAPSEPNPATPPEGQQ